MVRVIVIYADPDEISVGQLLELLDQIDIDHHEDDEPSGNADSSEGETPADKPSSAG